MKYLLLLGFLLAILPSQNPHTQSFSSAKQLVVLVDHVASLASTEHSQKSEKETDDPHALAQYELKLPLSVTDTYRFTPLALQLNTTAYYPIRAPPSQV